MDVGKITAITQTELFFAHGTLIDVAVDKELFGHSEGICSKNGGNHIYAGDGRWTILI